MPQEYLVSYGPQVSTLVAGAYRSSGVVIQ